MPIMSRESIKNKISLIGLSLLSLCKEAADFARAMLANLYAKLILHSKQISAALLILLACWVLSYSLIITVTLTLSYIVYAVSDKADKTRRALDSDEGHRDRLSSVKAFSSDNGLETLAYRVYGYMHMHKKEAYKEPSDFDIASCFNITKSFDPSYDVSEEGVNALFATSINAPFSAVVGFRGTDSSDPDETVLADFEIGGPGYEAYQKAKEQLFVSAKATFRDNDKVNITGHSFGGGSGMMFAADLLEKIANKEDGYAHITEVNLVVFQSTGVDLLYSERAQRALAKLATEKPNFKFNMAAHCYEGDIVHASAPYLMSDQVIPANTQLYLVYKHMTLWVFLTSLFSNIFSAHSLPFYSNQGRVESDILADANLRAPMQVYSSSITEDQSVIRETYKADYMRFLSNGVIHSWLSYIGINRLKLVRDITLFTLALTFFALKLSAFITVPTLITYSLMLVSLLPLLQTIYAPSLEPIRQVAVEGCVNTGLHLSQAASKVRSACSLQNRSASDPALGSPSCKRWGFLSSLTSIGCY